MKIVDTYIWADLQKGDRVMVTATGLGTRTATLQYETKGGWVDYEVDAVSSGDSFESYQYVKAPIAPAMTSRIRVVLDAGAGEVVELSIVSVGDADDGQMSDAEIKAAYENNADTNAFTDAEKTLLGNQSGTNTGDQDLSGLQPKPAEGAFVDGDKTKLDGITAPVSVADAAERKALSGIVGVTRVIQSDLIGIIWTLVADDESLDSSWIGQPYTVNPDGTLLVNYQLADVTGIVPAANTLGHLAGELRMGDGVTTGGKLIAAERIHHVLTSDITVNNSITFVEWFPDITLDEGVYAFRVFGMFGGYGSGLQLKFKTKATFSSSGEIQASGKWASIRPGTLSDRDLYLNAISTGAGTVWLAHDHEGTHNYYYMPEFVDAGANLTIEGVIRCVGGTGTLDCEFAQSVAIATDLVAKAGSVIEVVKVG